METQGTPGERRLRRILRAELAGELPQELVMKERTLTDADVDAVVDAVAKKFYINLGKGVFNIGWKFAVLIFFSVASYGAAKGWWK